MTWGHVDASWIAYGSSAKHGEKYGGVFGKARHTFRHVFQLRNYYIIKYRHQTLSFFFFGVGRPADRHELRTSSSSHGIACSGDGDGGGDDDDSNSYSGGGGDTTTAVGASTATTAAAAETATAVDTNNKQQSTKSGSGRLGGGGGGRNTRTTVATTADGTMALIAATTTTAAAVATVAATAAEEVWRRRGGVRNGCVCPVSSDGGRQKITKAVWRFHPTSRRHVFDAVLKHG
jgi:hypothetical protein